MKPIINSGRVYKAETKRHLSSINRREEAKESDSKIQNSNCREKEKEKGGYGDEEFEGFLQAD